MPCLLLPLLLHDRILAPVDGCSDLTALEDLAIFFQNLQIALKGLSLEALFRKPRLRIFDGPCESLDAALPLSCQLLQGGELLMLLPEILLQAFIIES